MTPLGLPIVQPYHQSRRTSVSVAVTAWELGPQHGTRGPRSAPFCLVLGAGRVPGQCLHMWNHALHARAHMHADTLTCTCTYY